MNKVSWEQALHGQSSGLSKESGLRLFSFGSGGAGKSRFNIPKNPNRLSTPQTIADTLLTPAQVRQRANTWQPVQNILNRGQVKTTTNSDTGWNTAPQTVYDILYPPVPGRIWDSAGRATSWFRPDLTSWEPSGKTPLDVVGPRTPPRTGSSTSVPFRPVQNILNRGQVKTTTNSAIGRDTTPQTIADTLLTPAQVRQRANTWQNQLGTLPEGKLSAQPAYSYKPGVNPNTTVGVGVQGVKPNTATAQPSTTTGLGQRPATDVNAPARHYIEKMVDSYYKVGDTPDTLRTRLQANYPAAKDMPRVTQLLVQKKILQSDMSTQATTASPYGHRNAARLSQLEQQLNDVNAQINRLSMPAARPQAVQTGAADTTAGTAPSVVGGYRVNPQLADKTIVKPVAPTVQPVVKQPGYDAAKAQQTNITVDPGQNLPPKFKTNLQANPQVAAQVRQDVSQAIKDPRLIPQAIAKNPQVASKVADKLAQTPKGKAILKKLGIVAAGVTIGAGGLVGGAVAGYHLSGSQAAALAQALQDNRKLLDRDLFDYIGQLFKDIVKWINQLFTGEAK